MDVQGGLVGILGQQANAVITARLQFALDLGHRESRIIRVQEWIGQRYLEHPYRATSPDRVGLQGAGELRRQRGDGGKPVQSVQRDPWVGQVIGIGHRNVQRAVGRAAEQQIGGKGKLASGGIEFGIKIRAGGGLDAAECNQAKGEAEWGQPEQDFMGFHYDFHFHRFTPKRWSSGFSGDVATAIHGV